MKEFLKSVNIWQSYVKSIWGSLFLAHPVANRPVFHELGCISSSASSNLQITEVAEWSG